MNQKLPLQLIIITGLSGAGKSTASHFFEDSGYFCMDNVPPTLLPKFIQICLESSGSISKIAVVIDARGGSFFASLQEAIDEISAMGIEVKLMYFEASDDVLIKRFSETRRKHPLSQGGRIVDDIRNERTILEQTRAKSDFIIDTSSLTGRELQEEIRKITRDYVSAKSMSVVFVSFGFKHGIPLDCDMVFDVRFLPNPHYVPELQKSTGLNAEVRDYVFQTDESKEFAERLQNIIEFMIPQFIYEPRSRLQIGIGCTGGRHRSVAYAEFLHEKIHHERIITSKHHRDIKL